MCQRAGCRFGARIGADMNDTKNIQTSADITTHSNTKSTWHCADCDTDWSAAGGRNNGCPRCAVSKLDAAAATSHAKNVLTCDACGFDWVASPAHRNGCPRCANAKTDTTPSITRAVYVCATCN